MSKEKVFIIDDDEDILEVTTLILSSDYEVFSFRGADKTFYSKLKKENPRLILMDYITPLMNTDEAVGKIRMMYGDQIKIIVFSAHPIKRLNFKNNVDGLLQKPFSIREIKDKLGSFNDKAISS